MTAYYRLPRSIFDTTDADVPQGYAGFNHIPQLGSFVLYEQPLTLDETLKYMLTYAGEAPASKAQIQAAQCKAIMLPLPRALMTLSKTHGRYRLPVTPEVISLPAPKRLEIQPITQREAFAFIETHHRHHQPPQGYKFAIAVNNGEKVVGVVIIGRPVSRMLDDGYTAEVTRCCTDGTKNVASMLYAAAQRACRAMGYRRVVTYTLISETGTSLKAAGWKSLYTTPGKTWNVPGRARVDKHPLGQKVLWESK